MLYHETLEQNPKVSTAASHERRTWPACIIHEGMNASPALLHCDVPCMCILCANISAPHPIPQRYAVRTHGIRTKSAHHWLDNGVPLTSKGMLFLHAHCTCSFIARFRPFRKLGPFRKLRQFWEPKTSDTRGITFTDDHIANDFEVFTKQFLEAERMAVDLMHDMRDNFHLTFTRGKERAQELHRTC
jgi:hypothetical protein